jgi:hypothetical protein
MTGEEIKLMHRLKEEKERDEKAYEESLKREKTDKWKEQIKAKMTEEAVKQDAQAKRAEEER